MGNMMASKALPSSMDMDSCAGRRMKGRKSQSTSRISIYSSETDGTPVPSTIDRSSVGSLSPPGWLAPV